MLLFLHLSDSCLPEERPRIETRKIDNDEAAGQLKMTNDEQNMTSETGFQNRVLKVHRHRSELDWTVRFRGQWTLYIFSLLVILINEVELPMLDSFQIL